MRRTILFLVSVLFLTMQPIAAMAKKEMQNFAIAPDAIGVRTLHFEDKLRERPVLVELWYPAGPIAGLSDEPDDPVWIHPREYRNSPFAPGHSRYPLILMSHGHRGDRRERTWLADALVKSGFLVASVEHFGNTWSQYNPVSSLRFWDRALDITFALDQLLSDPLLKTKIDSKRIGFVGYSLGGMTGLALAGAIANITPQEALEHGDRFKEINPEALANFDFSRAGDDFRDPRISSALLICPAAFVYPPDSLKTVSIPIALVAAINDEVLPHWEHSYKIIKHLVPQKLKVMRKEISHFAFLNRVTEAGRKILHKAISNDSPCCDRIAIHREVSTFAIDFFKDTLKKK